MKPDLPIPEDARGFYDPDKLRDWLFENTKKAFEQKLNKLETDDLKVRVSNVRYEPKKFSIAEQKKSILEKKDVTVPLKANIELIDKNKNQVLDKKDVTLAHVPHITERNTVIYNGSEYIPIHQIRLQPGTYSRIRQTGEAEAFLNVRPGTGINSRILFNPETQLFTYLIGTTTYHLYSLLRDLGISDNDIEKSWGKEIYMKNKQKYDGSTIEKLFDKIFAYKN